MDKKNITTGILLTAVGLLVLLNPETCIKVIVILLGLFSLVKGIYDLAKMRSVSEDGLYRRVLVIQAVVSIVMGIVAVAAPFALFSVVQDIVRIMLYVLAVYLILEGLACFFMVLKLKEGDAEEGVVKSFVHQGLCSLLVAVILFLLPQNFGILIVRALGCIFIIGAVITLLYTWHNRPLVIEPDAVEDVKTEALAEKGQ
ncbi:MAG: DUF308 domain-containing protein [Treponema sp.]|nr:DUF308 domain-containing protein [Treponema sp.]